MIRLEIPLKLSSNWKEGKRILLKITEEESTPYLEQARHRLKQIERRREREPLEELILSK